VPGREDVEAMLMGRQLSTRDKNLARQLSVSPLDRAMDLQTNMRPVNFRELEAAIARETRPAVRALLVSEHNKLKQQAMEMLQRSQWKPNFPLAPPAQPSSAPATALHGVRA